MKHHQVKVWKMDEYCWVAARSAREAKSILNEWFEYDDRELKALNPQAMSDKELADTRWYRDEPFDEPSPSCSFQERLAELVARGETFPTVFAVSEY